MTGHVSLVGAGPGDPELLTLRAVSRLRSADVVFYDALVDRAVLEHAPQARHAYVGKRAGRPSIAQETIIKLLIKRARAGDRIVRLKSGDPFVFGRGGEEMLALAEADIPCEIVPGVSSVISGPALTGIPVTHRGSSTAFLAVSGHAPSAYRRVLSSLAPGSATIVVLMGLASRAEIAQLLLEQSWPASTPSAVILSASHPNARNWRGPLSQLGSCELPEQQPDFLANGGGASPGLLVIGSVVSVADQLNAFAFRRAQACGA